MIVIAIDGPAAAGKGTLARRLAAHYGLRFLDTGALYRAVAVAMREGGHDLTDEATAARIAATLDPALLEHPDLRAAGTGEAASRVASMPAVRAALLDYQRRFAATPPGAVLDGRDIGTVVCPDADVKLFVTAAPEVRARRRWRELKARGEEVPFEEVLAQVKARDARDMNRPEAPLRPAPDAHLLDTSELDIEAAFQAARRIIDAYLETVSPGQG